MHSSDGHCRPFDADASGTVFSDGVGAVVLKRLADAEARRRSHRGRHPRLGGHQRRIRKGELRRARRRRAGARHHRGPGACRRAPDEIGYVEAHGSATPVGDPIEVAALTRAFRRSTDARAFCGLGSVKSNIGHADTAAGIAG
jgi:acyl transferase domain-containing protein